MQAQLRDTHDESEVLDEPDSKLVSLVQSDVVIRKVALAYILQRLTEGDLASAKAVLLAVGQVCRVCLLVVSSLSLPHTQAVAHRQALNDAAIMDEGTCTCASSVA